MWSQKPIVSQCLSACKVARSSIYLYFLASLSKLSFDLIQRGESINVTSNNLLKSQLKLLKVIG